MDYIKNIDQEIKLLKKELYDHKLYTEIMSIEDLRLFMGIHVHCVKNFMNLVKFLQNKLCPIKIPWEPPPCSHLARFINEIVLAEETDEMPDGRILSHYEMYTIAMKEVGSEKFELNNEIVRKFNTSCDEIVQSHQDHLVAAAFAFGREQVIPTMFRNLLKNLEIKKITAPTLYYYIERHIDLDEEIHGPLANEILTYICQNDRYKWEEVKRTAIKVIKSRIKLWDGILATILESRSELLKKNSKEMYRSPI